MAETFDAGDFGKFLDCMEKFHEAYATVHEYVLDGTSGSFFEMDPEQYQAYRALSQMSIQFLDLKELFYQALASEARGAHLISAEYYSSVAQMNEALREMGFEDDDA